MLWFSWNLDVLGLTLSPSLQIQRVQGKMESAFIHLLVVLWDAEPSTTSIGFVMKNQDWSKQAHFHAPKINAEYPRSCIAVMYCIAERIGKYSSLMENLKFGAIKYWMSWKQTLQKFLRIVNMINRSCLKMFKNIAESGTFSFFLSVTTNTDWGTAISHSLSI